MCNIKLNLKIIRLNKYSYVQGKEEEEEKDRRVQGAHDPIPPPHHSSRTHTELIIITVDNYKKKLHDI